MAVKMFGRKIRKKISEEGIDISPRIEVDK
jgi:hypothetical protein